MIAEYEVTNYIEPEEYLNMRLSVGWTAFPKEQAEEGIKNSAFVCCIRKEDKPIAMARVIWDHGYTVFISDVIVKPEYQKQGLGRLLMEKIMDYLHSQLKTGYRFMVCLMAAKGKEEFYKKFGFIDRPNENFGCGMHQWLEA